MAICFSSCLLKNTTQTSTSDRDRKDYSCCCTDSILLGLVEDRKGRRGDRWSAQIETEEWSACETSDVVVLQETCEDEDKSSPEQEKPHTSQEHEQWINM